MLVSRSDTGENVIRVSVYTKYERLCLLIACCYGLPAWMKDRPSMCEIVQPLPVVRTATNDTLQLLVNVHSSILGTSCLFLLNVAQATLREAL